MFPKSPSNSDSSGADWERPGQVCETSFPASSKSDSDEPAAPDVSYNEKRRPVREEKEELNWWARQNNASSRSSRRPQPQPQPPPQPRQRRQRDLANWGQNDDGWGDFPDRSTQPSFRNQEQKAGRWPNSSLNSRRDNGRQRRTSSNQRPGENGGGRGPRSNMKWQQQSHSVKRQQPLAQSASPVMSKSVAHPSGLRMGPHSQKSFRVEEKRAEAKRLPENNSGDEVRLDSLKCESEPLPPVKRLADWEKNEPCYEFLNKFEWNGLRGQSYLEQSNNQQLVQKEGHGLGCKCQHCVNILLKEKKVKGETQDKQSISILYEIASQEGAKIDLWVKCQSCEGRFKEDLIQGKRAGKPACSHCGASVHPRTCMYGYKWDEEYLEGIAGAANQKEAKRMAAEKALDTLERKWNYGEQIVRCREGKKGLPKDPGKYVMVSKSGQFSEYVKNGKALRESIFEQHKKFQDIAHQLAPNFEWHKLDKKKGRVSKAKLPEKVSTSNKDSAIRGIGASGQFKLKVKSAKKVEASGKISEQCKAPAPPVLSSPAVNTIEKYVVWDEEWNPDEEDKLVEVDLKTFYSDGCVEQKEEVALKISVDTLSSLLHTKYLDDLCYDVKQFYDVILRRRGEERYCYLYDRRYVAICHCGGEVIRKRSEHMEGQFNCSICKTAWVYCQGCDQLRWPLEPAEVVCGEQCVGKVDISEGTWYCKECWRLFIVDKEATDQNKLVNEKKQESSRKQSHIFPVPPPVATPPPRPPESCNSEPRGPPMDFLMEASDLPDFDMSKYANPHSNNPQAGKREEEVALHHTGVPKLPVSTCLNSLVEAIITLKFDRANEIKSQGVCFDTSFEAIPEIYIRILTKGLLVSVEGEDKDAFVVIAKLEINQEPGEYSFKYLAKP